jgi:hypothetical protein
MRRENFKVIVRSIVAASFAMLFVMDGRVASAQTPGGKSSNSPVYAILSLVGDRLEVVSARSQVGSLLDTSVRMDLELSDASADNAVVQAVGKALKANVPNAEISQLNTRSKVLFEKYSTLFSETNGVLTIPEAIRSALEKEGATHFVLVTKHRQSADDKLARAASSSVRMEGLGFFTSTETKTRSIDTGVVNGGYIAAYAYLKISIADAVSGRLNGTAFIADSQALGPANGGRVVGLVWEAITMQERLDSLALLVSREAARVIPSALRH